MTIDYIDDPWEDERFLDSEEAAEIADCEALIASGYYDECMCGRNGDHGRDFEDDYFEDDFDYE